MRVITGIVKGHKIKAPKGLHTRPTTDRVKESVFNILGTIDDKSTVLDLFSGSGNIGIEFLSRGAKEAYFIDNEFSSVQIIKENLINTKLNNRGYVYKNTVEKSITILGNKKLKFNYIFMDPPYEKDLVLPTLECIRKYSLLLANGSIIIEHETKNLLPDNIYGFIKYDYRKYGRTSVTFYKDEEDVNDRRVSR